MHKSILFDWLAIKWEAEDIFFEWLLGYWNVHLAGYSRFYHIRISTMIYGYW